VDALAGLGVRTGRRDGWRVVTAPRFILGTGVTAVLLDFEPQTFLGFDCVLGPFDLFGPLLDPFKGR
jgi:hypothetical protein